MKEKQVLGGENKQNVERATTWVERNRWVCGCSFSEGGERLHLMRKRFAGRARGLHMFAVTALQKHISSLWSVHSTNTSDSSLEQGDMLRGRTTVRDETRDL